MYKHKLLLLPVALLLAFMALACAPPDDDDRSSGPSKPTINNAIYDFATALLTVQGSNLSPTTATQAQIQTIRVGSQTNGVDFSSYTADEDATGVNSNGLEQGKYRMKSDGTALWLKLTEQHKAVLEAKVGSDGLKKGLLTSSGAWAGLDTAKDLTVNILGKPSKQTEAEQDEQAEEQSPKQPEDEQAEEAEEVEEQSPKQAKAEQVEQAEEESPKQTEVEQAEQDEQAEDKQSHELPEAEQTEEVEDKQSKTETEEQSPKQPKAEEQSPKAAITGTSYNVGTALLTLQGTDLGSATQAQIQTIKVYDLVLSSYIADATATGPDSRGLAKGKYRLHSDGTALWLKLTDADKATLNGKTGMDSNGLKDGLLTSTGTWAGLDTAKALAVSGNPAPTITRATYDVTIGFLVITGVNLPSTVYGWDFSKLTLVSGDGSNRFTLPRHNSKTYGYGSRNRATGSSASATGLQITLIGSVKTEAEKILVNDGDSDANGAYNLEAAAGFAGGSAEDTTNPITVSGYTASITSATYNANTGELYIRGIKLPRAVADWDFSKLRLVSGDGSKSYTLPRHATAGENTATGSRAGTTYLSITLSGSVKAEAEKILVKEGVRDANGAYNLEAAAGFAGGSAEDTSNPITVSGYVAKITSVIYFASRGLLQIAGVRLPRAVADWDFSKLTLVSGDGSKKYTLPRHATAGENTATGSSASATGLNITLSGSVKAEVNKILVKAGLRDANGAYNLKAAAEFVSGSPEDPTISIYKL